MEAYIGSGGIHS